MKKALPLILAILFGIILLVTLLLGIVRTDLQDASLMGFVNSSLGLADSLAGKKSDVPGLIKFCLSDTAFICFIALSAVLCAVIILLKKKLAAWYKDISIPVAVDGFILLIASPVVSILYANKVPKIAQAMLKNIYSDTQRLIIGLGICTFIIGAGVFAVGKVYGKKGKKARRK